MIHAVLVTLAFAASGIAASGSRFTPLEQLLAKRQDISGQATEQVQGLLSLANDVLSDAQAGNITSTCQTWATSISGCQSNSGTDQAAVAACACGSTLLDQMTACATAYGSTGPSQASGFTSFCTATLPALLGNSSAASSVAASATSEIASLTSAASAQASATVSVSGSSSHSGTDASSAAAPSSTGSSGAAKLAGAGGAAGVVALLAAALLSPGA
ncbi:hypothetical protein JCM21900_004513 [Sporobolomyces salmonicolor]